MDCQDTGCDPIVGSRAFWNFDRIGERPSVIRASKDYPGPFTVIGVSPENDKALLLVDQYGNAIPRSLLVDFFLFLPPTAIA